jgi:hypothetical protein
MPERGPMVLEEMAIFNVLLPSPPALVPWSITARTVAVKCYRHILYSGAKEWRGRWVL